MLNLTSMIKGQSKSDYHSKRSEDSRKGPSVLPQDEDFGKAYAKIKLLGGASKSWQSMPLPLTIGSSVDNDVVFRSMGVAPHACVIGQTGGRLQAYDIRKQALIEQDLTKRFGLAISGPYFGNPHIKRTFKTSISEWLMDESRWFSSLPDWLQKILGRFFSQRVRLSLWAVFGIFLIALPFVFYGSDSEFVDRSHMEIPIAYGGIYQEVLGSTAGYRDFARGITFQIADSKDIAAEKVLISFEVHGIDRDGELELLIGEQKYFEVEVDKSCFVKFCEYAVPVANEDLARNNFTFFLRHTGFASDYMVRNIRVESLRSVSDGELIILQQRYGLAKRAFDERAIAYQNIITAHRELKKLKDLLNRRQGADELRNKVQSLTQMVSKNIESMTEQLWFEVHKEIKLGRYSSAQEKLTHLGELYQDPKSKGYQDVRDMLDYVKEMME